MIFADTVRHAMNDPFFFWMHPDYAKASKTKAYMNWLQSRYRKRFMESERYVLDADATEHAAKLAMCDPSRLLKAMPIARLPFDNVWIEIDPEGIRRVSGDTFRDVDTGKEKKVSEAHQIVSHKMALWMRPFRGAEDTYSEYLARHHPHAILVDVVFSVQGNEKYAIPNRKTEAVMNPIQFILDPVSPLYDNAGEMIGQNGEWIRGEAQMLGMHVPEPKAFFGMVQYLMTNRICSFDHEDESAHEVERLRDIAKEYTKAYKEISKHGCLVRNETLLKNALLWSDEPIVVENTAESVKDVRGLFRLTIGILVMLNLRYPEKAKLPALLRRNSVEPERNPRTGQKSLSHVDVRINTPRTFKIDYEPYIRNTLRELDPEREKRRLHRHMREGCWRHNWKATPLRCDPYGAHDWQQAELRLEKNADPVPDPNRYICTKCGLKRWHVEPHESGTPGMPFVTRDRYVEHKVKAA